MVEADQAYALMGNHEYNAICFHTTKPAEPHRWMRSRTDKNLHQHIETLYQFRDHRKEWDEHLEWFSRLPLWLDLSGVRAVHAAWHSESMDVVREYSAEGNRLTADLLEAATIRGNREFSALQNILKGPEIPLPQGTMFADKDGNERTEMRIRWWLDAATMTYGELGLGQHDGAGNAQPDASLTERYRGYDDGIPVFFGHYWLRGDRPEVFGPKIACLDYSVASGGFLTAYTWEGEEELDNCRFTFV
jgi:hypothetical protein